MGLYYAYPADGFHLYGGSKRVASSAQPMLIVARPAGGFAPLCYGVRAYVGVVESPESTLQCYTTQPFR